MYIYIHTYTHIEIHMYKYIHISHLDTFLIHTFVYLNVDYHHQGLGLDREQNDCH